MTTKKRRFSSILAAGLGLFVHDLIARIPSQEEVGGIHIWLQNLYPDYLRTVATFDRNERGRIDTRSLRYDVWVYAGAWHLIATARRRDILVPPGYDDDPQAEARMLLYQLGHGIPDTPEGLT